MQNRDNPEGDKVGHLGAEKAYAFIDAVRVAFDVGALGFGASGNISRSSSLTTAITVEGFCSALSLIVAVHESVTVCCQQCCRRDGKIVLSTNHSPIQYSNYLTFRFASVLTSLIGMALIAGDIAAETNTVKTTIGLVAISLGIFASRALTGSQHKPTGIVLAEDDIELGLLAAADDNLPPAPPAPIRAAEVPLVVDPPAPANNAPAPRARNQFFQPQAAAAGPQPEPHHQARHKVKVKRKVTHPKTIATNP